MKKILVPVQIIISLALIGVVLLQGKGAGLGSFFGGQEVYHTKKGIEKAVFFVTIVLAALFLSISIINLLVN